MSYAAHHLKEKQAEVARRYRQAHPARVRATQRQAWSRQRAKAIEVLGGQCAVCGSTEPAGLDVHHVNGGGTEDRRTRSKTKILYAVAGGEPGFQLLCRETCHRAEHLVLQ